MSRPLNEHARFGRSKSGQEKCNFVLSSTRRHENHPLIVSIPPMSELWAEPAIYARTQ
jgi:hypothetical protein